MKTQLLSAFIATMFALTGWSQTQFWSDNFEDAGAPSSGTRTPSGDYYCSAGAAYFTRTALPGALALQGTYTGHTGKVWAGENLDVGAACTESSSSFIQTIEWSVNVAGKSGLSFTGAFAANNISGGNWDPVTVQPTNYDFLVIEYRFDGAGAWNKIIGFYAGATAATNILRLDTDGDLIGDAGTLTYAFGDYAAAITGTGTTLNLRFSASSNNAVNEEFAIENFRLFETPTCTAPVITANPPNRAICAGNNTTFTSNASGATAFQWQENSGSGFTDIVNGGVYSNATTNVLTITGATAGMSGYLYRCRAMNGVASCFTNTNQATLTVSSVNTSSASQTNISCNGGSNGAASVSPTGGIAPYSYSWSPSGGTGSIATGLTAGTYTVTVTDNIGCQGTRNYTLTQPPVLNGSTVVTNVACNGGTNGAINLTPSGGTPGYTFNWGGGVTTEDRTGLAAGTYAVIITDANGCTRNVTGITLTQPAATVSGTTVVTNIACFGGNTGAINLTPAGGTGPYTFNWVGGITTEDRTSLTAGTYSVTITDANGCTGTVSPTVTQPAAAVSGTTVVTNIACFGGNTGAINLTPTGGTGPYTFNWVGGITTEDRTSLTAGTYSVTITDANGCTGTVSPTVTQPAAAVSGTTVVTNVACFGGNTGAINLTPTGGVGPYTFNWVGGITTEDRTGLTAGTYSVTITDVNGCTGTVSPTVTQPAATVSGTTVVTNVACFGGNTGAINLTPTGGVGPYTFNWVGGITTEDRTGLTAGTYSVTITDANGCTGTVSPTVTQPAAAVSGTTVVTNVACFGGNTGAINLTPTGGVGPYTFNWVGGITTEDRTSLTAGTYSVTITDANGCTGTVSPTVTQPAAAVSGTTVVTNVTCFGGNTGAINLTPTGGTGPYTFNWLPSGPTTEDRTGLVAGTYQVQVTDINGCTGTVTATVTQPTSPVSGTTVVTNVACFGGNTGAINLTPTGGVGPYTFNWGGGITTEDRTSLTAGTYSVTITDFNGCTGTVSPTVTQPAAAVSGTRVITNVSCFGGNNGAINLTPTGGVGPYTFNWGGGITTEDRTGLAAATYAVIITDANGCTGNVTGITVTQPSATISGTTVVTNVACDSGTNGSIDLTPTGGTPGYTYNWGGGITSQDRTGLAAGTYSVIITDANGCTGTVSGITVTQPSTISFTAASQTNVSCFGGSNGAFAMNAATGGTGSFTYDWVPGTPTGDGTTSVTGLTAGSYTVTATDANGCTATQGFTITEPSAISFTAASQTNVSCFGGSNGAFAMNAATGGAGSFTYDWAPGTPTGDGTTSVTGLTAGSYTVTATDANGCAASQSFTVTQPTALAVTPASQTNIACNGGATGAATINTPTGGTPGYTYDWTPGTPTGDGTESVTALTAGTYTVTVTDANGCAASQSFTVTQPTALAVTPASQTNIACNGGATGAAAINTPTGGTPGYTYDWTPGTPTGDGTESVTALTAGTYTVTVTDANGCAASQSFTITEPALITSSVSVTNCDSYTLNGQTYTMSGTYIQNLTAVNGCDSILTLNLTINNSTSSTTTVTECDSYEWTDGTTYTVSGTYTQDLTNSVGCDSTATLVLTINNSTSSTTTVTECDSYEWTDGTTYTVSGTYTQDLTNSVGCDSTATLVLTINNSTSSTTTVTECDSYEWTDGTIYTVSGTYTQDLTNSVGCDSTATLVLTINNSTSSTTTVTECDSYEWTDGTIYTVSGTYTQDLTNSVGCDSTATLVLTINNSTSSTTTVTECDSYEWTDGTTYTVSGTYTQDLTNSVGCDSTAILNLTITTMPVVTVNQTDDVTLVVTSTSGTYQWIDCVTEDPIVGETAATFTATQNGSYAVVVTNGPCSVVSACTTIDNVGIEENAMSSFELVNVYPNPFNNALTVVLSGNDEPTQLVILDALGRTVFVDTMNATETTIDVSGFASGMYVLKVISGDKIVSRSITK